MKGQLQELGEETDENVENISKMQGQILNMTKGKVNIFDGAGNFKSTYEIMKGIAEVWDDLSSIDQANLLETIAGKNRANDVAALLSNWENVEAAVKSASEAEGSAARENAKYVDSLQGRLDKLTTAWQSFANTFMESDFLKGGVSALTGLLEVIEKIVKTLGSFGTIGLGVGIFGLFKNFKEIKNLFSLFSGLPSELRSVKALFGDLGTTLSKSLTGIAGGIGIAVAAFGLIYNAIKNYKEKISEARQETIRASDEFLDASISFERAYAKYSGKTNLTAEEEAELETAINGTVDALNDKSSKLQTVVNSSNDYLASLEQIKNAELEAAKAAADAKKEKSRLELEDAVKGWTKWDGSEVDVDISSGVNPYDDEVAKIAKEVGKDFYTTTGTSGSGTTVTVGFELAADADINEIADYYHMLTEYQAKLSEAGLEDTTAFENVTKSIDTMSEAMDVYIDGVYEAAKAAYMLSDEGGIPTTTEEYLEMREAILRSDDIVNKSFDTRKMIANTLDSEYAEVFDLSSIEAQARKFVGLISGYGDGTKDGIDEIGKVETFLNMRTAVNNNECTVGQYLSELDNVTSMSEKFSDEEQKEFNTSFGLDTDTIKQQYDDVYNYISNQNIDWFDGYKFTPEFRLEKENIKDQEIKKFIDDLSASELEAVANIKAEIDWENTSIEDIQKQIQKQAKIQEALRFEVNIEVDTTALEALNEILAESASAMGLSTKSIESLQAKYSDLDSYNPSTLFEKTANGVKVNRQELEKLENEYNNLTKTEVQEHLDTLINKYNDVTAEIDKCANAGERAELIAERETYADKIEELATYQAQLEGVTGAYQEWLSAQESPEDYEGYEAVATGREDIEDEIDRGFIGNSTKKYIDLLSGEDLDGKSVDDYADAWEKLDKKVTGAGYSVNDFFTVNDDGDITSKGIDRFFKSLQTDFEGSVAKFDDKTKKWSYDFGAENLEKIKEKWGIGIEAIELLLEAAASAGYDIDWGGLLDGIDLDTSSFETLVSAAEAAQTAYNKIEGLEDVHFNFTATGVKEAESEIEKARQAFSKFINEDGTVNLKADGAEEMQFILTTLIIQKQQLSTPAIMKVDTSQIDKAKTKVIEVINAAQTLQSAYENYEIAISTGVDVEKAKQDLNSAISTLEGTDADIRADLKLPSNEELQSAASGLGDIKVGATLDGTSIGAIATQIQTQCTPEVIAKVTGIDESAITNGEGGRQVKYTPEHSAVDAYINGLQDINKKIIFKYTTEGTKPNPNNIERTITYEYKTKGEKPKAEGTAHANGSASGKAFARGNWGISGNGIALGGELGQELVVRDGRFFTVGDVGAEFFRYKKNDIVFNAAQTESLFKYGGIKGAKPRGKMLASGSAFAEGSYPSSGRAFAWEANATSSNWAESRFTIGYDYGASKDKDSDKSQEIFDWIEVAIERIEREIDNLDTKANSVYRSWSERNTALAKEINAVGDEIALQQSAYEGYMSAANQVGLSSSWAAKVRSGAVDIDNITDETLADKISDYQKYYEAALDCKDAIEELKETEASLYAQRFENIQTQYDGILQGYEHTESMLNEYISQAEAQGYLISKKYYQALIDNEEDNIATLKKEQSALLAERDKAVEDGKITKFSQEWYNMCGEIDSVTEAIEEGTTAILEYAKAMEEIDWEKFDMVQERFSALTEEADFLIELMSNDKLHDDNGNLTNEGMATLGLHGQNYNTYMYQADEAGAEAARLKKDLDENGYRQDVYERYREMVSLQQESILAAEAEKDAIRDLVEEGIELELDALQEKIDLYNEAIESQKDLYDYQKRVKEQTEEIASLEKQMAAYAGDNSEEAKAKVQELKVSLEEAKADLEETEYEKFIDDQQKLLDDLYLEYETTLNTRLDNVDALLEEAIMQINYSAAIINDTLIAQADSVGITLSTEMQNIWGQAAEQVNAMITETTRVVDQLVAEGLLDRAKADEIKELLATGNIKGATDIVNQLVSDGALATADADKIKTAMELNKGAITTYSDDFKNKSTTTNTVLGNIQTLVNSIASKSDKEAETKITASKTSSSSVKNPVTGTSASTTKSTTTTTNKSTSSGDGVPKIGDKVTFVSGKYYYDPQGKSPLGAKNLGKQVYITNINKNSWATHQYHISTGNKLGSGDLGWLKLNQLSGYATGKKDFLDDEIAWTQEGRRQEFIVRPSDGAILTPIAKGDSILNAAASSNIWDMANSPAEFIKDNLNLGAANVPNNSTTQSSYTQNFEKVIFNMPNVKNYGELLSEMQKDPKFEKLILAMTLDQVAGKSSLAKGKAIR